MKFIIVLLIFSIFSCANSQNTNNSELKNNKPEINKVNAKVKYKLKVFFLHSQYWGEIVDGCKLKEVAENIESKVEYTISQNGFITGLSFDRPFSSQIQNCIAGMLLKNAVFPKHQFDSFVFNFTIKG